MICGIVSCASRDPVPLPAFVNGKGTHSGKARWRVGFVMGGGSKFSQNAYVANDADISYCM